MSSRATWDSTGLPDRLVTTAGAATLDERRYRWDDAGQLIGVEATAARGKRDIAYTLDALGRLQSSVRSDGRRVEYEMDSAGNRTLVRVDGKDGRYTSGPGHQPVHRDTDRPAHVRRQREPADRHR